MITQEVTRYMFHDALGSNFTYEAKEYLYNYYSSIEEYELDPVTIRCEWNEYESLADLIGTYPTVLVNVIKENAVELSNGNYLMEEI